MSNGTRGHKVPPLSRIKIRQFANKLRKLLGIPDGEINLVNFIELVLPQLEESFELDIVEAHCLGHDHARTYPSINRMEIRLDVYEGLIKKRGRDRFTVAHEIGHLFLHRSPTIHARTTGQHAAYEDSEWQADTFAAEFLMPYEGCLGLSPEEIQQKYKVSFEAATNRFKALNK